MMLRLKASDCVLLEQYFNEADVIDFAFMSLHSSLRLPLRGRLGLPLKYFFYGPRGRRSRCSLSLAR